MSKFCMIELARGVSNISISLVPKDGQALKGRGSCCCKMVSLTCLDSPSHKLSQLIRSRCLPSQSTGCFIVSTDIHLLPNTSADIVCTYTTSSDVSSDGNHTPSYLQLIVLPNVDETLITRCAPLHSLSSVWAGELHIEITDQPSQQLIDVACHLGSKRMSKIQLHPSHHYTTRELISRIDNVLERLPFPVISMETTPCESDWLLPGVCLVCSIDDSVITLTVVHRLSEELEIIRNYVRKTSSTSFVMV